MSNKFSNKHEFRLSCPWVSCPTWIYPISTQLFVTLLTFYNKTEIALSLYLFLLSICLSVSVSFLLSICVFFCLCLSIALSLLSLCLSYLSVFPISLSLSLCLSYISVFPISPISPISLSLLSLCLSFLSVSTISLSVWRLLSLQYPNFYFFQPNLTKTHLSSTRLT